MKKLFLILPFISFLALGCDPSIKTSVQTEIKGDEVLSQTYTNSTYNYSFQYPFLLELNKEASSVDSDVILKSNNAPLFLRVQYSIDRQPNDVDQTPRTIEQILTYVDNQLHLPTTYKNIRNMTIDSLPAFQREVVLYGNSHFVTYVLRGNDFFQISGNGDQVPIKDKKSFTQLPLTEGQVKLYNRILSTFRFIK